MRWSDFRIGWRLLAQEPFYSAVSVLGLAAGFCACFLLLGFVGYSLSYDAQVPDAGRVFTIKSYFNAVPAPMWMEVAPLSLVPTARGSTLVMAATGVARQPAPMRAGVVIVQVDLILAGPDLQRVFGLHADAGDIAAVLRQPDAVALTRTTALRLFGSAEVLGKTLTIRGRAFRVLALLPDPPANTTIPYAAIAGLDSDAWPDSETRRAALDGDMWMNMYFRLAPGASAAALLPLLQNAVDRSPLSTRMPAAVRARIGQRHVMELRLGALRDAYFDPDVRHSFGSGPRGDPRQVLGLALIALLILALAAANYINLATVRTLSRRREIGVRRMMGAPSLAIAGQFLAESVLVALLAAALGVLLAYLVLPLFSDIVERDLNSMLTFATVVAALLAGLFVGLAAGAWPAWTALRVDTSAALSGDGRGQQESRGGIWLRRALTALQLSVAMGLGAVTLTIALQTAYTARLGPGFDTAPLLVIDLPDGQGGGAPGSGQAAVEAFRAGLMRRPFVLAVGASDEAIGKPTLHFASYKRTGGVAVPLVVKTVSRDYFDAYGLHPLAGRLYDQRDPEDHAHVVVINAAAARALGFAGVEAASGQVLKTEDEKAAYDIVGIAPDIRHQSLRAAPQPVVYALSTHTPVVTVRVSGDMAAARRGIEALYRQYFPDDVLSLHGASEVYAASYAEDGRLTTLLMAATVLAIVIATFGIYVLAAFNVQRQAREIVLRKLYGAGRADIARLMGREFAALLAAGAAIGLPAAAAMNLSYLAGFAERAPIGPWALAGAFAAAALVALLAILRHAITALTMVPAAILK